MAQTYCAELAGRGQIPVGQGDGSLNPGRVRVRRATIPMTNPAIQSGDTVVLGIVDIGEAFLFGIINADAGMGGTATLAIGNATTAGKYRAAATFNAPAPTLFGVEISGGFPKATAVETILLTVGAAALPTTGTLQVDMYFAAA